VKAEKQQQQLIDQMKKANIEMPFNMEEFKLEIEAKMKEFEKNIQASRDCLARVE
jgi:small-conductance mechanosensitive channel